MLGNAWQWLEDCYHERYTGAPADGTPRTTGECKSRVARGACWLEYSQILRAANLGKNRGVRYRSIAFRVAGNLQAMYLLHLRTRLLFLTCVRFAPRGVWSRIQDTP